MWDLINEEFAKTGIRRKRYSSSGASISRASIINFLNSMVDEGLLDYTEITGKGGHRRIYSASKREQEFWEYIIRVTSKRLIEAAKIPIEPLQQRQTLAQ